METLNLQQIQAVHTTEGRIRVTAGAGTGKTRVLSYRYAYLVEELGISPANILCLTFTNKAACEMKRRLTDLIGHSIQDSFIGTIHAFCLSFLREEFQAANLPNDFILQDMEDSRSMAKLILQEYKLRDYKDFLKDVKRFKELRSDNIMELVEQCKQECIDNKLPNRISRYIAYQSECKALDYDDLILYTRSVLANNELIRKKWQEHYNYIQVDECQDCNENDWNIIKTLSGLYNNLFVVGDPDQSIYAWRGAKPNLFVDFKPDYDFVLDLNYRSSQPILDVGNRIIRHNKVRIPKELCTKKQEGSKAKWYSCTDLEMEGEVVANIIKNQHNDDSYSDSVILFRSSSISRTIEQSLIKANIPYMIWGGVRFYERKEIKDILCYMCLTEREDDLSLRRIINVPNRGIGSVTIKQLELVAKLNKLSLLEAIPHCQISGYRGLALRDFYLLISDFRNFLKNNSICDLVEYIVRKLDFYSYYRGDIERIDNIHKFVDSVRQFDLEHRNTGKMITLEYFFQEIALYTNLDQKDDTKGVVKLMTIHQSKGMEFKNVYICGVDDGVFPSYWALEDDYDKGIEEERRLMYVASTRAQENLVLIGKDDSFFKKEIGKGILDEISVAPRKEINEKANTGYKFNITSLKTHGLPRSLNHPSFDKGDIVEHANLGLGLVLDRGEKNYTSKVEFGVGVEEVNNYLCKRINIDEYLKKHKLRFSKGDFVAYNSSFGEIVDLTCNKVTLRMLDSSHADNIILYMNDKDLELIIEPTIGDFYYSQIEETIAFTLQAVTKNEFDYTFKGIDAYNQPVTWTLKQICEYRFKKGDKNKYLVSQEKKQRILKMISETEERLAKTTMDSGIDYAIVDEYKSYLKNDIVLFEGRILIVKAVNEKHLVCITLTKNQERRIPLQSNIKLILRSHPEMFITNGKKMLYIKSVSFTKRGVVIKQLASDMRSSSNISVSQLGKGNWRECTERDFYERLKSVRTKSKYIEFKNNTK